MCRSRLTIWRSLTTADDGVRRGLERGAGAAIMLFPSFLCVSTSASTPSPSLKRINSATLGTERANKLTGGRWMDGWWIHHGLEGEGSGTKHRAQSTHARRFCRMMEVVPAGEITEEQKSRGQEANPGRASGGWMAQGPIVATLFAGIELRHCSSSFPSQRSSQGLEMTMGPRAVDVGWTRWRPEVAVEPACTKAERALHWIGRKERVPRH